MTTTQEQVRRALLDAHPYKIEDLDNAAKLAMEVGEQDKGDAKKILRDVAKGNGLAHFGLKERAERVVARLDEAPTETAEEEETP